MNALVKRRATLSAKITLARLEHRVGRPGLVGIALVLVSVLMLTVGWPDPVAHQLSGAGAISGEPDRSQRALGKEAKGLPALPAATTVPLLLTRLQRVAVAQGLGWPRADYRLNAATDDTPANVDVRFTLKGPYPNIRRFVATVLQDTPTLTLREFSLSRPNSSVPDVEAKVSLVIYLADQPSVHQPTGGGAMSHARPPETIRTAVRSTEATQ